MARTLEQWLLAQQSVHLHTIDLGLERVGAVARALGLLPVPYPSVIVGGTNGKGSTVALLAALARAAGLRCATFTSPHLRHYNERIQLDGQPVADAQLVEAFERIDAARGSITLTFFEYNALAALLVFAQQKPSLAVLEVGLGGRLDATNLVDADVAVLCSVGFDHCEWLGDTLEQIGREKAGIFRAAQPVVLGAAEMPASVHARIALLAADARLPGRDFHTEAGAGAAWGWRGRRWHFQDLPAPALAGSVQRDNAAAALAALEALAERRLPALDRMLSAERVAAALRGVALEGRLQLVPGKPQWILDVAHNPPAAARLAVHLAERPGAGRTIAVCAMLGDKDVAAVIAELRASVDLWVLGGIDEPRGLSAAALRQRLPADLPVAAQAQTVAAACEQARALARPDDRILVFGSFHTVGPALDWLRL